MEKRVEFPVFKTKIPCACLPVCPALPAGRRQARPARQGSPRFDLADPRKRAKYFQFKAGPEIAKIKDFLDHHTFLAIMMGKKGSGKGTYSKLFTEIFGEDKATHVAVGDIVRSVHQALETKKGKKEITTFLQANYRGYLSIEEGIEAILNRSQDKVSVPNELMLALLKREIDRHGGKALFIDGFPRTLDQVSYSLYFRDLAGYRDDPDFFILIDIPEAVIDERIKYRVVCPLCQTSRNLKLLPTSKIAYDIKNKQFYLICDNPTCRGERMMGKEGDALGIELIRGRLEADEKLIQRAFSLHGMPKILLRNAVPLSQAKRMVDDYEVTPEYVHHWNGKEGKVETTEKPWVFKDDQGRDSISLLAPPVVVSLIKQLADLL